MLTGVSNKDDLDPFIVFAKIAKVSFGRLYYLQKESADAIINDIKAKIGKISFQFSSNDMGQLSIENSDETKLEIVFNGNSQPKIYNPKNEMTKAKLVNKDSLLSVKNYEINSPSPGIWKVEVNSYTRYSIRVGKNSKHVTLYHGFSVDEQCTDLSFGEHCDSNNHSFFATSSKTVLF